MSKETKQTIYIVGDDESVKDISLKRKAALGSWSASDDSDS